MQLTPASARLLTKLLLVIGLAVLTVAGIVGVFMAKPAISLAIVGGSLLTLTLSLSGNPRLFCLWGLFMTAPISLDISFMIVAHMGGAGAFTLDIVDFFIAALLFFLIRDFFRGYRHHVRISKVTLFWGILILLGFVSMAFGPLRLVMAHEIFRMLKLLLLFLVVINEVVRIKQFKHAIAALMVGVAIQCFIGLAQYAFGISFGAEIIGEASRDNVELLSRETYMETSVTHRISALFGHPNLLAAYLALVLPIGIGMLFTRISPYIKVVLAATVFAGLIVLILALSRSAWIAFGVAFVILLAFTFLHPAARFKFLFGRVSMIGGTAFVGLLLAGPILKRLLHSDPGALSFRWEWALIAWEMVKTKPILGFGLNTFVFHAPPYSQYGTPGALVDFYGLLPVVHNIYLIIWSEQGTIGLAAFLAMNAYFVILAWRNAKHFDSDILYMLNAGCIAGLMAIAVDGIASFFIRNPAPARVYFIVVGLLVAVYFWHRDNSMPPKDE